LTGISPIRQIFGENSTLNAMDKLLDLGWGRLAVLLLVFAALIAPSMLLITVYSRPFFDATDLSKLLLISIGAGLPLFAVNAVVLLVSHATFIKHPIESEKSLENVCLKLVAGSCVLMILPMYGSILFKLFIGWGEVRTAVSVCALIAVLQNGYIGVMGWWCSPCPDERADSP